MHFIVHKFLRRWTSIIEKRFFDLRDCSFRRIKKTKIRKNRLFVEIVDNFFLDKNKKLAIFFIKIICYKNSMYICTDRVNSKYEYF